MGTRDECRASLFREFCGLKAGLRKAVIAPASWTEEVRQIIRALEVRPAPVFFSIPGKNKQVDAGIFSLDYQLVGEISSILLYEGEILAVDTNRLLGQTCGYPSCCVERFELDKRIDWAYKRYKEQCEKAGDPYDLRLYEDEEGWVWVFSQPGISHIPCSPTCSETAPLSVRYSGLCTNCTKMCKILNIHQP